MKKQEWFKKTKAIEATLDHAITTMNKPTTTEDLSKLLAALGAAEAQRDQLLEALRQIATCEANDDEPQTVSYEIARAAIAAAGSEDDYEQHKYN